MTNPTQREYREMFSPGLDDLMAEVVEPEGFAGKSMSWRRREGGMHHEMKFVISRNSSLVRNGALMHVFVAVQPKSAAEEFERLVPGETCQIRIPGDFIESAAGVRPTMWAFDSARAAVDLLPSIRRTMTDAVLPYLEARRTPEGLLACLIEAVAAAKPPPVYQPRNRDAAVGAAVALSLGRDEDARRILAQAYGQDEYLRRDYARALEQVGIEVPDSKDDGSPEVAAHE